MKPEEEKVLIENLYGVVDQIGRIIFVLEDMDSRIKKLENKIDATSDDNR